MNSFRGALVPLGTFVLAVILSALVGSTGLSARSRPASASTGDPACHTFSQSIPPDICVGVSRAGVDAECEQTLPEPVPGAFGEFRETRRRKPDLTRHTLAVLADGQLVGGANPAIGIGPTSTDIQKQLSLIDPACPSLPHNLQATIRAELRVRVLLTRPLTPGGIASGAGFASAPLVERRSDLGLNERTWKSLTVSFSRIRTPGSVIHDSGRAVIVERGKPVIVKRPVEVGENIRIEISEISLGSIPDENQRFNRSADMRLQGQALALYARCPAFNPPENPDDDGARRATVEAEIRNIDMHLFDQSEGIPE